MSGKFLARAAAISLAFFLVACGGDDSSSPLAGSPDSGGDGGGDPSEEVNVGTLDLFASPTTLDTSPNANSSITARVKGPNGVLLSDVPVTFNVNNGGTLEVTQNTTEGAGTASAVLTTSSDLRNRTITVSASAGGVSQSLDIDVSGTSLALTGPPSISFGSTATYRADLINADGDGIAGQPITISSSLGTLSSSNVTTSDNGSVIFQLTGTESGGTAEISATAFSGQSQISARQDVTISGDNFGFVTPPSGTEVEIGTTQSVTVQWKIEGLPVPNGTPIEFTATRGNLNPANGIVTTINGEASIDISSSNSGIATINAADPDSGLSANLDIEFISTQPDSLNLQATKTQLNLNESTEILAVVRDADNNLVKNQDITFRIVEDNSGGTLSSSTGITDSQGRATTTYAAGSNSSGRDGVQIEASASESASDIVTLTVARQALRLAIGTGNELEEPDSVRYRKPYLAIVTDANGAPVENADVELSVLPVGYSKGMYIDAEGSWFAVSSPTTPNDPPIFCEAEDTNRNGQLDPDEDRNENGALEPTNSATTNASSVTTGADGSADFSLLYPQSHCNWVRVELIATVRVGGTESVERSEFFLSCLASDLNNTDISPPGGNEGLYGSDQSCESPN